MAACVLLRNGAFPPPDSDSYTDIGAKLGTVAIGIGIGIGIGSVETVLHIIIEPNFIGIGNGIGVGQWKCTINQYVN